MAYTAAQLQAIEDAIATGELSVEFEGKHVTYRGMTELIEARNLIRGELIASGAIVDTEIRSSITSFSKD